MKKILSLIILLSSVSLSGCMVDNDITDNPESSDTNNENVGNGSDDSSTNEESSNSIDTSDIFSNRDYNEDIMYTECFVSLTELTSSNDMVVIESNVITINQKGSYIFTGSSNNVKIVIDTEEKVQLILQDVTMTSDNFALIHMLSSDKTFIRLDGTNTLTTTMIEEIDSVDGAIFAKDNICFNGTGVLTINSSMKGIVAKDDLTVTNATFNITTTQNAIDVNEEFATTNATYNIQTYGGQINAPYQESEESNFGPGTRPFSTSTTDTMWSCKGIKVEELLYIKDGVFNIDSYDDAIHCDDMLIIDGGEITILSGDDGIHSDFVLEINGGTINVNYAYEGLEAQQITINDGILNINSYDDGINGADYNDLEYTFICINDGTIIVTIIEIEKSPEADGLDSNGDIYINGGYILVHGTTNTKDTPLDYDGVGIITGGTFLTAGSYSMTCQNFGTASQGAIYYQLSTSSYYTSDVILKDSSGNVVIQYTPVNKYQVVHISSPDIKTGQTYTLCIGTKTYLISMTSNIYGSPSHKRLKKKTA